tara:strand:- start:1018 stop:1320 length:303 start_codon:yes stop_codon:yes gene_type:complete
MTMSDIQVSEHGIGLFQQMSDIQVSEHGTAFTTPNGIELFRLSAMRAALKLESKGLKSSKGSMTALAKRELGIKGNRDKVMQVLDVTIEKLRSKVMTEKA